MRVTGQVSIDAAAGADELIVAAPGAGKAILVVGGEVHADAVGTVQVFHTDNTPSNALSGNMTLANGGAAKLEGILAPENKSLVLRPTTAGMQGWISYLVI